MRKILFDIWFKKIKIIENRDVFRIFLLGILIFLIGGVVTAGVASVITGNYIILFVLAFFITQYNKPQIIADFTNKKNITLVLGENKVCVRYLFYCIAKNNFFLLPIIALFVCCFPVSLINGNVVLLIAIIMFQFNLFWIETYIGREKALLLCFLAIYAVTLFKNNTWCFIVEILNAVLIFKTLKKNILNKMVSKSARNYGNKKHMKVSLANLDLKYFSRLSMKEIGECVFQIVVLFILAKSYNSYVAIMIGIIFLLVELELLEDCKSKDFEYYYGKRNFYSLIQLSNFTRFRLSLEYKVMSKSILALLLLLVSYSIGVEINGTFLLEGIGAMILEVALSFRFYKAFDVVLKQRGVFTETNFRLIIMWIMLVAVSPFLFEETLIKIEGYRMIFGSIFMLVIATGLLLFPMERVIKVWKEKEQDDFEKQKI